MVDLLATVPIAPVRGESPFFFNHFFCFLTASTTVALVATTSVEALGEEELTTLFLFFSLEGPTTVYFDGSTLENEMPT